ncbi:Runt domain [Trinorchestia longiramus]|nr:Runt domain [Trinorchestia longiramus]
MTVSNHHTEMNQSYAQTLYDMSHMGDMVATESPNIFCSTIPSHWRSNKSLPTNFRVFIFDEVKDGTVVTIRVGNDDNFSGELRNNTASVKDNIAQFNDLRFIGRSGRGKCFSLSVIVNTCPAMMTTLCKAIKITVDGPREPRNKTRGVRSDTQSWSARQLTSETNTFELFLGDPENFHSTAVLGSSPPQLGIITTISSLLHTITMTESLSLLSSPSLPPPRLPHLLTVTPSSTSPSSPHCHSLLHVSLLSSPSLPPPCLPPLLTVTPSSTSPSSPHRLPSSSSPSLPSSSSPPPPSSPPSPLLSFPRSLLVFPFSLLVSSSSSSSSPRLLPFYRGLTLAPVEEQNKRRAGQLVGALWEPSCLCGE